MVWFVLLLVGSIGGTGFEVGVFFAGLLFSFEAFFKLFDILFPETEVGTKIAAIALDAIGRWFASGLFGRENLVLRSFAHFTDSFRCLFLLRFAGEPRGDLKSVEVDASLTTIDAMGTELAKDLVESDLHACGVFDRWEQNGLSRGGGDVGVAAGGVMKVAEWLIAERRRFALIAAGQDVTTFLKHEILPDPCTPGSGWKFLNWFGLRDGFFFRFLLGLELIPVTIGVNG